MKGEILKKVRLLDSIYDIKLVDSIKNNSVDNNGDYFCYGLVEHPERQISLSIKDTNGKSLQKNIIKGCMYHEIVHAILTDGGYDEENSNEALVEWIAKNIKILIEKN